LFHAHTCCALDQMPVGGSEEHGTCYRTAPVRELVR
jgi:hypothetical protein